MAGKLLSWDNFAMQLALISAPLVLSQIYSANREAVYYVTAGVCLLGMLDIGYVASWKGARDFGKKAAYSEHGEHGEQGEQKSVEMGEMESKGAGENPVMVDITNAESPSKSSLHSPEVGSAATPAVAEAGESAQSEKPAVAVTVSAPVAPSNSNDPVGTA